MSKTSNILEERPVKKHVHGLDIQDELAKTYFHAAAKKDSGKKYGWRTFTPWLIAGLALVAAAVIIFSRSSIDINVRLLGEIPAFNTGKSAGRVEKGIFLLRGSEPDNEIIKNAYFSGDAKSFSVSRTGELMLINGRGAGWANYTLEFKGPVNLNNLDVRYSAKGARADEYMILTIADNSKHTYRMEKDLSSSLAKEWQEYSINFKTIKKAVDLSNITAIKFEFGSLTAGNYPAAVIYLKDIYLAKTRRWKWL